MSQVADYNIANASGASVRSDINAVLDAIKTCNSGGSDPANPEAFMLYADTADSNTLKIRRAANDGFTTIGSVNEPNLGLLPKAGGSMTGVLKLDSASSSTAPTLSFDNDSDTGFFRSNTNEIGVACAGNKHFTFGSDGLAILSQAGNTKALILPDADNSHHVAIRAPSTIGTSYGFTLPSTIVNGGFLQTDSGGNLSFQIVAGVPSGSVFCMAVATVPSGYLECNGAAVSRTTYAALFAVIGTQYGSTNSSNFKVPDLRGEFVRGFDNGRGADSGRSVASFQGASNASHNHSISLSGTTSTKSLTGSVQRISETFNNSGSTTGVFSKSQGFGANFTPGAPDVNDTGSFSIDASHNHTFSASGTSGSQGSEARPRNVAMMYIIKV